MDYIRFSVRGQRLDYDKRYYSSTDTIDTLYCNFKFETDGLGHILGGWDLPHVWAQFHDENDNVYVKEVTADNTCSIPYSCLRQHKFKMTLFATDTENYMEYTKRYTTNEVLFIFNGLANLNYDGGISPDEPIPTQWQILIDRVDACESSVDRLSQDVSSIESDVSSIDERVTTNTNAIDGLSQNVTSMQSVVDGLSTDLAAESTSRSNEDARLEGLIGDRYTKTETDALLDAKQDSLNDSQLAAVNSGLTSSDKTTLDGLSQSVPSIENAISDLNSRVTTNTNAISGINATVGNLSQDMSSLGGRVDELSTELDNESTARENADANLQSLIDAESTARENADADLQLLINDEVNERASGDNALQNSINALNARVTTNENDIDEINDTVELLYKTLKKDNSWNELSELVRSGKAEQFLNYGDQIEENWIDVDNNNKEYSNIWDIAKFEDVETREGTIKGMFLKQHWATLRPIQFSHNRAFYACRDGLSAGTYYITLGSDWGTNAKKDKSYQFTITNDVPAGGKLAGFYSMPDVAPANWKVYAYDANGIDILENAITVTEGTDGTFLGTLKLNTRDGNLNSMQETAYGNNDWELSAYRQYLNSREVKGLWWTAQDEWDIAPDQLKTVSGFLCGISDELYNSMQTVKVKTWKNNPTYGGIESYTYDKVFLPSKEELYYTPQKSGEGTYYPLMKEQLGLDSPLANYTNYAPNITYAIENHSSAQYVRHRSADLNCAHSVWIAYASGNVSGYGATYAARCTPVCVIG